MEADRTTQLPHEARAAWEQFRAACFIRPGPFLIWHWAALHEFDLMTAGLHLAQIPGARFDLGTHAVALVIPHVTDADLQEWHLVPLTRLTKSSIQALQPAAAGDLAGQVLELVSEQRRAQDVLDLGVKQSNLWRLLPGSTDGTIH